MELTAKEILEKYGIVFSKITGMLVYENSEQEILAAMKEAVELAVDKTKGHYIDDEHIYGESKEQIINSLFPESK